ncbi:hypothetical protein [Lysinibacillus sp. FJAT-14222]|uniref:hypothetical protein n=1 Tax=Lysinibacillus sp. FJAT-14222 TaxID=1932366 RepID=UPI0006B0105C|nr:hypothetical protein [Lysinibacillus sp. FJAT-14222]KOS63951.1 hypothetical protein AN161_05000 [Lysinibacillus sp. FJAT-14222]
MKASSFFYPALTGSNFLCESEATATNGFCAKAKRQQQMVSVRKRSDSNKCFLCESEATATRLSPQNSAKAKKLGKITACKRPIGED